MLFLLFFFLFHMEKPFKKTHQNTGEEDDDVQSRTQEEKEGRDLTRTVDMERVVQHDDVMFLPF